MTRKELESLYRSTSPDGFVSFMNAVKKSRASRDISTIEAQSLLCSLADEQIEECRKYGEKNNPLTKEERAFIIMAARLVACSMTILTESRSRNEMRSRALLLLEYVAYTCPEGYNLPGLALKCLSYPISNLGFSWSMIESATSTDMLVYLMETKAVFDTANAFPDIDINLSGSMSAGHGHIKVSSTPFWEMNVPSFAIMDGEIEVCTRNSREERIKATGVDCAVALESFARIYQRSQEKALKMKAPSKERKLELGKRYSVQLERRSDDKDREYLGCFPVGIVGAEECEVNEEELVKGTFTSDILPFLYDNDFVNGAELVDMECPPLFSIKESYQKFAKEEAEKDRIGKRCFEARVSRIFKGETPDKDRLILISNKGYGGLMRDRGVHKAGDIVVVNVVSVVMSNGGLFINLDEPDSGTLAVPERFDKDAVLSSFVVDESEVETEPEYSGIPKADAAQIDLARKFARILSRTTSGQSIDRYKALLASSFIAETIGDTSLKIWVRSRAEYLCQCLKVAEGVPINKDFSGPNFSEEELRILHILTYIECPDDIPGIASLFDGGTLDGKEGAIAQLLMAGALSKTMPDQVKTNPLEIRKKIAEVLGVGDHFSATSDKGGGKYGRGELSNVEFKSSYVFSNKTGQPDIDYQGRGQVFEAVCGFLNADGGTVYVGVNNYGDPLLSEDYGLNADIKWFTANFDPLLKTRIHQLGHPIPKPKDLDSLCLFLNDEKELYFKPSVTPYITISPTEDFDAVRIDVKPSEFEIARLYRDNTWTEGIAYVRNGGETLPMSLQAQEQRLMKLRSVGKVEKFIIILTEAIDKKQKVILKGYSSSNSNEVRDRFVVPINLVYNNENLWAYDIEAGKPKEFRLARIEEINTNIADAGYPHAFPKGESDIFRWINPDINIHVKLRMTIGALNNLREEYSTVKNLPEKELYQESPDKWILDTVLHGWGAVRRFYMGLADQIEILDTENSEELKKEIRKFRDSILQ